MDKCRVIQTAMLVTDENLSITSPDFCIIIKQDEETLNNMNDWCKENLKDLAEASRKSGKFFKENLNLRYYALAEFSLQRF